MMSAHHIRNAHLWMHSTSNLKAHFTPLSTRWALFTHHSLPEYGYGRAHVAKLKSFLTGFMNMTTSSLYSDGLHIPQISIQWSTFGMWWSRRCHLIHDSGREYATDKSAPTVWRFKVFDIVLPFRLPSNWVEMVRWLRKWMDKWCL